MTERRRPVNKIEFCQVAKSHYSSWPFLASCNVPTSVGGHSRWAPMHINDLWDQATFRTITILNFKENISNLKLFNSDFRNLTVLENHQRQVSFWSIFCFENAITRWKVWWIVMGDFRWFSNTVNLMIKIVKRRSAQQRGWRIFRSFCRLIFFWTNMRVALGLAATKAKWRVCHWRPNNSRKKGMEQSRKNSRA